MSTVTSKREVIRSVPAGGAPPGTQLAEATVPEDSYLMRTTHLAALGCIAATVLVAVIVSTGGGQQPPRQPADVVQEAQTPRTVAPTRPEQNKTEHDRSDVFTAPAPSSPVFEQQPDKGRETGFVFARDSHGAARPGQTFEEIMKAAAAEKPTVASAQRRLLDSRYDLTPKLDSSARMSRGKPLAVGPTARLPQGMTWDRLASLAPDEIRSRNIFPYPSLPHPKQAAGGQVFPQMQVAMFPRLERFDVEFDLPQAFLPEFPPGIFLQSRPELGDVSRGEVVSINNFDRLCKDLVAPVQLDGLRLLVTPFPQEEFNATDDRKSAQPSLGVTCLDCHVNGHHWSVPPEPGQPATGAPIPPGHGEPARAVQPADPRLQAEPAIGRGLHGVRAADGL